jgi:threonine/homoserine/homoserine lactone efflux protein
VILFFLLVGLAVPLAVSVYIYRDANRRGSRHALAWAIGAFLGGIIVWLVYFVVRDEMGRSGV